VTYLDTLEMKERLNYEKKKIKTVPMFGCMSWNTDGPKDPRASSQTDINRRMS